ncbi:glycoside hydrolase family 3 N-terminal domain-containing protein [Miniimonas sp. S16]|uniref:glycoside hydrolase family 3 N-terminal domain-containing protein n=1 Tax=Miniimonas sp. S16 TaxID=2171623 RepID=UPI000D525CD7|nr:glycoside hydrolase family 3 N-terminal domain-containing protein [Miniimonas sp. S16]
MPHHGEDPRTRSDRPWADPARPVEERVAALLDAMTLPELVGQLHQPANVDLERDAALLAAGAIGSTLHASGATAGNVRDGGVSRDRVDDLQRAAIESSRLGIPLLIARDVIHGHRTVAPIPLGQAATFDEQVVHDVAARAALEARADGLTWTFAPMLDVVDDPRWGRVAESFGESPLLTARLGAAAVRGFQASGLVTACAKHYVGYGLSRGGRDYATAEVGEITLRNRHLVPFRAAVDAGVGTVMAAFCDVDGVPMHSHHHLLREVLKGEWGFDGVVVADWNGIGELVEHGVAADLRDAARLAIEAGVDVDMVSGAYAAHLAALVEGGEVDLELVRDAARRVLRLKVRLGLLDPDCASLPGRGDLAGSHGLGLDRALAREAAARSFVVLRNDGVLPLRPRPTDTVLLTGAYTRERASLLGTWVLDGDPEQVSAVAPAVVRALGELAELAELTAGAGDAGGADTDGDAVGVVAEPTVRRVLVDDGAFADRTLRLARDADLTVAFVGEHAARSGEDGSTSDVGLPPGQLEVLRGIAALGSRLVVVVLTGRPLALGEVLDLADAVVLAWHPGTEAGEALADVLVRGVPATGRLPMSLPRSVGHLPITHAERPSGRPLPDEARGRGRYIDAPSSAGVPFGAGASALAYGSLTAASGEVTRDGEAVVTLEVTNRSDREVREPVLLFLRDEVAEVTRPVRELVDVQVVTEPAGASVPVTFRVPAHAFGYHGRDHAFRVDPGRVVLTVGWPRADASAVVLDVV